MKSNLVLFFFFITILHSIAQVKSVSYDIRYNNQTGLFDAFLLVNEGEAHSQVERLQFNAQFSIVTPGHTSFSIEESFMPLENNRNYKGTKAARWEVASFFENEDVLNGNSIYAVSPRLFNTSFYNDLKEGSEVKLFSMSVTPVPVDKKKVRIFDNIKDPSAKKFGGSNFENGFTMGGVTQLYNVNHSMNIPNLEKGGETFSKVYPNPALDHVTIDYSITAVSNVKVIMTDNTGKIIISKIYTENAIGNLSRQFNFQVTPGMYTISIDNGNSKEEHKIVVVAQI
jgi:hypothetical protein